MQWTLGGNQRPSGSGLVWWCFFFLAVFFKRALLVTDLSQSLSPGHSQSAFLRMSTIRNGDVRC